MVKNKKKSLWGEGPDPEMNPPNFKEVILFLIFGWFGAIVYIFNGLRNKKSKKVRKE